MHLVDDKHPVAPFGGGYEHLVGKLAYVVHTVVRGSVEFQDIQRPVLVELTARCTFVTWIPLRGGMLAVDGLGENAGARRFADPSRPTEKIGMCQAVGGDSVA